jgi:hypothetical protein
VHRNWWRSTISQLSQWSEKRKTDDDEDPWPNCFAFNEALEVAHWMKVHDLRPPQDISCHGGAVHFEWCLEEGEDRFDSNCVHVQFFGDADIQIKLTHNGTFMQRWHVSESVVHVLLQSVVNSRLPSPIVTTCERRGKRTTKKRVRAMPRR